MTLLMVILYTALLPEFYAITHCKCIAPFCKGHSFFGKQGSLIRGGLLGSSFQIVHLSLRDAFERKLQVK